MSILKRMVFREFFGMFLLGVISLTALFVIVDFFDRVQRYVGEWGAPTGLLFKFMLYKSPEIIYQMTPLALPLSTLIALGLLSRNRELIAIRAGGISVRSVLGPVFVFSLLCAALLFAVGEYFVPKSHQKLRLTYEEMRRYQFRKMAALAGSDAGDVLDSFGGWYRGSNGVYCVRRYEMTANVIHGLTALEIGPGFRITRRIEAARATWTGTNWIGQHVSIRDFSPSGAISTREYPSYTLPIEETPRQFETAKVDPSEMGFFALKDYIKRLEGGGSDMREFRVDLWAKMSYPLSGFLLLVLAAPLGLGSGRRAGMSVGIVISLAICITFYEFNAWMISIGHGGVVSPPIAAWSADVIYGLAGIAAYIRAT